MMQDSSPFFVTGQPQRATRARAAHHVDGPSISARSEHDYCKHTHGASYSSQASDEQYDYVSALLQRTSTSQSADVNFASTSSSPSLYQHGDNSPWTPDTPVSYASDSEEEDDRFCTYDDLPPSPRQSFHSVHPAEDCTAANDATMPLFQSIAAMLASTSLSSPPSLEMCFCGQPADEDSIYCSVACGRKDAMQALESKSGAPAASHYRRVELSESKKEKEREKGRLRAKGNDKSSRSAGWRSNATPSPSLSTSSKKVAITPPSPNLSARSDSRSTSHSTVPSLSSTTSSIDSYSTCDTDFEDCPSPIPFPSTPTRSVFSRCAVEPASPQPTLRPGISVEDMQSPYSASQSPFLTVQKQGNGGPRYSSNSEEERDRVPSAINLGWGGEQLKERVKVRMPRGPGHQRGKLSFDDVVGIMNA